MTGLKFMTFNCRGLASQQKRRDVVNYIKKLEYDVYLIQDTHLTPKTVPLFNAIWPGKCYHSCGTHNSRGTAILFKRNIQHNIIHEEYCKEGNFVMLVCSIFISNFTIVNIYGPNDDRPSFFNNINNSLNDLATENIIIGGDFNFVPDYTRDSNYSRQNNPGAKNIFENVVEEQNLVDTWRELKPGDCGFTWIRNNPLKYGRLDRFYMSEHLTSHLVSTKVIPGYRSDHSIVALEIKLPQKKRGPGIWKFNDSLLGDAEYDKRIKECVVETIRQYIVPVYSDEFINNSTNFDEIQFTISVGLFYETLLMMIRGETMKFSKQKAKKNRLVESKLESEIKQLSHTLSVIKTKENLKTLEDAQRKLEVMMRPKIQGLIARSRAKWHEEGERCSKYFLALEKRNATVNSIQLLKDDERLITKKDEILKLFSENLQAKYRENANAHNPTQFLEENIKRKLSDEQKNRLDDPLTKQELHAALMNMKKGKTPGTNGFTSEFFKHFWSLLGAFLFRAAKEGLMNKSLILSHRESIVTLIPKQGKPKDNIKGWRPISLLNVDFKIISSAFPNRLKAVIHDLISSTQTAYIPGRFIGENS